MKALSAHRAVVAPLLLALVACSPGSMRMSPEQLRDVATRYTSAWNSRDPEAVAAFYADSGTLTINDGAPAKGRKAIATTASSFMMAFPDLDLVMDQVSLEADRVVYKWTLTGTNTGPGGTGRSVRISGQERWHFGKDGLITDSRGSFDEADYKRQLGQ